MKKQHVKEIAEDLFSDDNVFYEFVEDWIKKNPDTVFDIIFNHISTSVNEESGPIYDDWIDYAYGRAEEEVGNYEDQAYEEWKEEQIERGLSE